ncbi:hypothetical protein PDUR_19425 [Paenibacillus durus]|uniref:Uncharacterized protein n=1 Tax=Paenibacillus durus TaxID=44251 RepID=A0A089HSX5_PAEDU|nr:hypothetical protein PDUR_19425 [Paenibacillus durus]
MYKKITRVFFKSPRFKVSTEDLISNYCKRFLNGVEYSLWKQYVNKFLEIHDIHFIHHYLDNHLKIKISRKFSKKELSVWFFKQAAY